MNERAGKYKKQSNCNPRPCLVAHMDKNPSTSSVKHPQTHCLPKRPPNIENAQRYAHPRRHE
jgi:hypothetical protein